ncbi:MAG: cytochrome c-type biogenesis protein CcmH [Gammaproteobacteria bacterium]|nr:cytochrome c-type biogenesis protein CcmH [Gammaproteobacteria bacterium]
MWRAGMVFVAVAMFLSMASPSLAVAAAKGPHSLPPELQARYQQLTGELRCPVCQNETIAVSQSRIAADLRRIVRERLLAGDSNWQIRDYMISRYGLFAVYDPPVVASTWLLWFGPLILLAIAAAVAFAALRRRRRLLASSDDAERVSRS